MIQQIVIQFLIILVSFFFQIIFVPQIALSGVSPDLLLILVVYATILKGRDFGMVFGAIIGLTFDLATGSLLGSSMFAKVLASFIIGYFYNNNKSELLIKSYRFALLVFLAGVINAFSYALITNFTLTNGLFSLFVYAAVLPAFYTAVLSSLFSLFTPSRLFDE